MQTRRKLNPISLRPCPISFWQRFFKRSFDIIASIAGILATGWLIILAVVVATFETKQIGLFCQLRVGRNGKLFKVLKIRSMRSLPHFDTTVTTDDDPRITVSGRLFRKTKVDELPQLINVLLGEMSFVGPRPDVPELISSLRNDDLLVLSVRPGITGPASLKYRYEESILAEQPFPEKFNSLVIFPDKVRINKQYVQEYSLMKDLYYLWLTLTGATLEEVEPPSRETELSRAA